MRKKIRLPAFFQSLKSLSRRPQKSAAGLFSKNLEAKAFKILILRPLILYLRAMGETSPPPLSRKEYFQLKEVEQLYKMIDRHGLRPLAYKKLLQMYIEFKKSGAARPEG